MRLKLVPEKTSFDFFSKWKLWMGFSALLMVLSFVSFFAQGLNFGIDFRGGTTVRTESTLGMDVGAYRKAIEPMELGDISITEVFDPTFEEDQHVAMIRIQAQADGEAISGETIEALRAVLDGVAPGIKFVLSLIHI